MPAGDSDESRVRAAFVRLYARPPSDRELQLGLTFLAASSDSNTAQDAAAAEADKLTRWERYAQVLLSANEFLYVD